MKKYLVLVITILFFTKTCYANWFQDIINVINKQAGITNGILNNELSLQEDMLRSQRDMQRLMNQVNNNLTSHSGYGTYQFHDYQSYGVGANDWSGVMRMAGHGSGGGELGNMISSVSREFPYDSGTYNHSVTDINSQRYYSSKAQTTLAARAASELDYNKIQDQIDYQQVLMKQIDDTKDIKAAMDLGNRIQVEGNLINLEILRQSAVVNQQQAITEQASIMNALSNAKFLNK